MERRPDRCSSARFGYLNGDRGPFGWLACAAWADTSLVHLSRSGGVEVKPTIPFTFSLERGQLQVTQGDWTPETVEQLEALARANISERCKGSCVGCERFTPIDTADESEPIERIETGLEQPDLNFGQLVAPWPN
jgi:hypothetical protein